MGHYRDWCLNGARIWQAPPSQQKQGDRTYYSFEEAKAAMVKDFERVVERCKEDLEQATLALAMAQLRKKPKNKS